MSNTLTIKWGTSRGRDSYGYITCSAWADGKRVAACNGGGYDMRGTVVGLWAARTYAYSLRALKPEDMPSQSHWEPAEKPGRFCDNESCELYHGRGLLRCKTAIKPGKVPAFISGADEDTDRSAQDCPSCGQWTRPAQGEGSRVDDGRYFYGLTFHDPNYDPGKAIIGTDTSDRTLGNATGQTVAAAEKAGVSIGLERYQAIYAASSKHATDRHTIPSIDGACGLSSVEQILKAIGITLERIDGTSKRDVYFIHDSRKDVI